MVVNDDRPPAKLTGYVIAKGMCASRSSRASIRSPSGMSARQGTLSDGTGGHAADSRVPARG